VPVIKCPLTPLFDVDEVSLLAAITPTTKIVFLCSPGNPTAKSIPLAVRVAALTRWT
jgi:histidinol-phosphate aminotransferase